MKVLNAIIGLVSATSICLAGWVLSIVRDTADAVQDVKTRVAVIEGNRFTSKDAVEQMNSFQAVVTALRDELARIRELIATLPKENPPEWFVREVRTLEARVCELERAQHTKGSSVRQGDTAYPGSTTP